ncbi:E3 ubiquitin-protein ligase rnf8-B-like isoform X2 [Uranotaenia lowii]|nr:E3 ubiquitin-protein ligase rnf8-B-like isoform X2 [Uranotaenia lowii]
MSREKDLDQDYSVIDVSSSDSQFNLSTSSCRYNLRNRGPPTFTQLVEQECPICLSEVFIKPVVINCGHTFCGSCIRQVLTRYKNCPICNQLMIQELFLNDTSYTRDLARKQNKAVVTTKLPPSNKLKKDKIIKQKNSVSVVETRKSNRFRRTKTIRDV